MPLALLAVLSEHGDLVTLSEFHDWYDNEHIPLRLDLSTFLTGARFSAIDAKSPSWLALTTRSEREAGLVERLEVLDRRICEVVWDSGESSKTTSFRVENPTTFIVTHSLGQPALENAVMWAEEAVQKLRGKEEWVRTRAFNCVEAFKTGVGISSGTEAHKAFPFFVLHEFLAQAPTLKWSEIGTDESLPELRKWELYRAYRSLSQKA
ncbi:hypothetical protein M378DRAFT_539097 [Amanita muscaria Koide BX008]|uniref:Uncharacterized protein n=1 Tax=Amanita muscaria (strain Koide BX008) TaxID=946122 RepID=A0A0C2X7S8_AMAMK|nr:hypothetical protein M378DRAFT_539097 [Amanita muscaria Koide BX008]